MYPTTISAAFTWSQSKECLALGVLSIAAVLLLGCLGLYSSITQGHPLRRQTEDESAHGQRQRHPHGQGELSCEFKAVHASSQKETSICPPSVVQSKEHSRLPTHFMPANSNVVLYPYKRNTHFPDFLPCSRSITINGPGSGKTKYIHHHPFMIKWNDGQSFEHLVAIAKKFIENRISCETSNRSGKIDWYTSNPQFSIVEQLHPAEPIDWLDEKMRLKWSKPLLVSSESPKESLVHSESIGHREEWGIKVANAVAEQLISKPKAKFALHVEDFYTFYEPHDISGCDSRGCGSHECLDSIRQRLESAKILLSHSTDATPIEDEEEFVPKRFLDNFFSSELVRHLVEKNDDLQNDGQWTSIPKEGLEWKTREKFISQTHLFGIRLLATCIMTTLGLRGLFFLWLEKGGFVRFGDAKIPLGKADRPSATREWDWTSFMDYQGRLRAHDFPHPDKQQHESIAKGIVVPVRRERRLGEGTGGLVDQVSIHEHHHSFDPNLNKKFALKTIFQRPSTPNIQHEREILTKLTRVPHPHITPLLASWSTRDRCMLLMPLAQQSLHDLLHQMPHPANGLEGTFVGWLLKQMLGLAAAVDHIHHLGPAKIGPEDKTNVRGSAGWHHDLKPRNILVTENGTLQISDFGTARLQQVISISGSHKTREVLSDPEYAAPDYDVTRRASRPADVFSLGCIFLEMILWALDGPQGVKAFLHERYPFEKPFGPEATTPNTEKQKYPSEQYNKGTANFWYIHSNEARLKTVVVTKIKSLEERHTHQHVFRAILSLIETMLSMVPLERPQASTVRSTLEKYCQQAELDLRELGQDYFMKDAAQTRQLSFSPPSEAGNIKHRSVSHGGSHLHPDLLGQRPRSKSMVQILPPGPVPSALSVAPVSTYTTQAGGQFAASSQTVHSGYTTQSGSPEPTTPTSIIVEDYDHRPLLPEHVPSEVNNVIWSLNSGLETKTPDSVHEDD